MSRHTDDGILDKHTGPHLVLPAVPRTGDDAAAHMTFAQRTAAMQTEIVDCVEFAVDVEETDPPIVDGHLSRLAWRNVGGARDDHELTHESRSSGSSSLFCFHFSVLALTTGFFSATHWFQPPFRALTVFTPRCSRMSAARALVASSSQAQ
jgi:hypothetical protein